MQYIELLAPAKDLEQGLVAIKCGADAVYIGAPKFGARSLAGNSIQDIENLVNFAHKYFAKVYVTINTILNDQEILEAERLIHALFNIGVDAIIIQDMGLLELNLPPIPLFASTQTHNNNWQKVQFLENVGFDRVILARELSLNQIKEIKSKTTIDLEAFIHGSLCVCYSGQCYLSYAIGGRSGNRGQCAQPCRKLYSLKDSTGNIISKDKYLLCLKDLNLSDYIKNLANAGISSFKIEGRLKDINYIKNIVSFYRQKIDETLECSNFKKSSSGKSSISFIPDPDKTFNRNYTDYFLNNRTKNIASFDSPKFIGQKIDEVRDFDEKSLTIGSKTKINNGDGITFFDENRTLQGTIINQVIGEKIFPNDMKFIRKNQTIYRNHDHDFLKSLKNSKIERKIQLKFMLYEENHGLILHAEDENNIQAEEKIMPEFELAKNPEIALDNIKKQLAKLGNTDFIVSDIEINLKNIYFIPVKDLNELRRNIINKLILNRQNTYAPKTSKIDKNCFPYPNKILTYQANVLNQYAENFYKRHGVEKIEPAVESGVNMQGKKVMTTKHCLRYHFNLCPKYNKHKSNDFLYLIDEYKKEYLLVFKCQNCEMEIIF